MNILELVYNNLWYIFIRISLILVTEVEIMILFQVAMDILHQI